MYIWNVCFTAAAMRVLRQAAPEVILVAGGPQLVPDDPDDEIKTLADMVVYGEGETVIEQVFTELLAGQKLQNVTVETPDLNHVCLPYELYSEHDLEQRLTYVETSRGCPFHCAYCTSAASGGIRYFPLERLLPAFKTLLERGARQLKFLDRSFNRGGEHALAVLDYLLTLPLEQRVLHFEFTPERLSTAWRARLLRFAPGTLHLEVGVQTWNLNVARRIRRMLNRRIAEETLTFLIRTAKADVHADLIIGLPGETEQSFAEGFDHLVRLAPAELQVGLLKSLPGTEIRAKAAAEGLVFAPDPPYEVLATQEIPFAAMQRLARFARCWDLLYNRKRFLTAAPLFWSGGLSPYAAVMRLTDRLYARFGRLHALAPARIAEALLAESDQKQKTVMKAALEKDARMFGRQQNPKLELPP